MTYSRSIRGALDEFNIGADERASLAESREVWRETLRLGHPPGWQPAQPTPPLALRRPTRSVAAKTNRNID
eukprot:6300250-Prymnesium_polylepis.1